MRLTLVPAANALKITRFLVIPARLCVWPSYLCSGIPFHSSNWQTEVFHFQDRSYATPEVHYFQAKCQIYFAMSYCSKLCILSWTMQFKLKNFSCGLPRRTRWRLHIVTKGFCNKHPPFPKYIVQMLLLWIHCLSYSRVKNNRKRRNAKSKKKLNSVVIQNKRAWITSGVYSVIAHWAGNKKTFWLSFKRKLELAFLLSAILRCCKSS